MASVLVFAYTSNQFSLRTITFYGCKQLDARSLESIIRHEFPENVLRINLKQLRNRLEQETWVESVEVSRVLPSDLVLYVEERIPSVILEMSGELMLADSNGILLDRYDPKYGKLDVPVFKGVLGEDFESYRLYQEENSRRIRMGCRCFRTLTVVLHYTRATFPR